MSSSRSLWLLATILSPLVILPPVVMAASPSRGLLSTAFDGMVDSWGGDSGSRNGMKRYNFARETGPNLRAVFQNASPRLILVPLSDRAFSW